MRRFDCRFTRRAASMLGVTMLLLAAGAASAWAQPGTPSGTPSGTPTGISPSGPPGHITINRNAGPRPPKVFLYDLFDHCRNGRIDSLASLFLYDGPDQARVGVDPYSTANAADRDAVEAIRQKLLGYLNVAAGYTVDPPVKSTEKGRELIRANVKFVMDDGLTQVVFTLVRAGTDYRVLSFE